jgi:hypothetical protein
MGRVLHPGQREGRQVGRSREGARMRLLSQRREPITADLRDRASEFERRYDLAPSRRRVAQT